MIFIRVTTNCSSNALKAQQFKTNKRRGVLLLITVCMLTLFLMLGTAYLVAASRARESANAIARKTLFNDQTNYRPETYLDNVLMQLVRGGGAVSELTDGFSNSGEVPVFESLLHDRYDSGNTLTGSVTSPSIHSSSGVGTGPVISLSFSGPTIHPALLNGRILTLVSDGIPSTSHRIIRAAQVGTSTYNLAVTNPRGPHQWTSATISGFTGNAIINGREFAGTGAGPNEAWDGFDLANPFLAQVEPGALQVSQTNVVRPSYLSTWPPASADSDADGITDMIDNDGDGESDGVFLNWGLPSFPTASGTIDLHASALIVDLDGRFNVNAHGSLVNMPMRNGAATESIYSPTNSNWPQNALVDGTINTDLTNVPLGSGVGPAEVNPNHMMSTGALNAASVFSSGTTSDPNGLPVYWASSAEQPGGFFMTGGHAADEHGRRPAGGRFTPSSTTHNVPTMRVGAVEGRSGGNGANLNSLESNMPTQLSQGFDASRPGQRESYTFVLPGRLANSRRVVSEAMRLMPDQTLQQNPTWSNGVPATWWDGSSTAASSALIYNSPPDLHGRMKFLTRPALREQAIDFNGNGTPDPGDIPAGGGTDQDDESRLSFGLVPRPTFAKAEWGDEIRSNPYSTRLTSLGTRGGLLHSPQTDGTTTVATSGSSNPFTLAEIEALLRPYDIDSSQLSPRLVASLGTVAEQMRTRLTTESWDTTGITDGAAGGAWGRIQGAINSMTSLISESDLYGLANTPLDGVLGGEIARGEKFNLNRPLINPTTKPATYIANNNYYLQRQAYFKDLYTLLVLLHPTPTTIALSDLEMLAQWAANVVEFRDGDSTMTPFEYDVNIFNGWDVDGDVTTDDGSGDLNGDTDDSDRGDIIWGAERPEVLITSGVGWESTDGGSDHGEIFLTLHRPWNIDALSDTHVASGGPVDPDLDNPAASAPDNVVQLDKSGAGIRPVWRIRMADGASDLRIPIETPVAPNWTDGTNPINPNLQADDWLSIRISDNIPEGDSRELAVGIPVWQKRDHDGDGTSGTPPKELEIFTSAFPAAASTVRGVVGEDRTITVFLERLSCPAQNGDSNWMNPGDATDSGSTTNLLNARYLVVDRMEIAIVSCTDHSSGIIPDPTVDEIHSAENTRDITGNQAFWRTASVPTGHRALAGDTLSSEPGEFGLIDPLDSTSGNDTVVFPWLNRPFQSPVELFLVPNDSPGDLLADYEQLFTPSNHELPNALLMDAVSVPTLFAGVNDSWVDGTGNLRDQTGIDDRITPVNQLSSYREPGRVNLNTITNDQTWDAVVAGPLRVEDVNRDGVVSSAESVDGTDHDPHPVKERLDPGRSRRPSDPPYPVYSRTPRTPANFVAWLDERSTPATPHAAAPATSTRSLLSLSAAPGNLHLDEDDADDADDEDDDMWHAVDTSLNPQHKIYTASRLANTATVRSNLFAVWVTLRESISGDADSVKYHRAFYIIDRSIPVGFQAGQDHNVKDTIRLRRIIE